MCAPFLPCTAESVSCLDSPLGPTGRLAYSSEPSCLCCCADYLFVGWDIKCMADLCIGMCLTSEPCVSVCGSASELLPGPSNSQRKAGWPLRACAQMGIEHLWARIQQERTHYVCRFCESRVPCKDVSLTCIKLIMKEPIKSFQFS
ncbi:unnamed protein product, partial [Ixodes pacificus]